MSADLISPPVRSHLLCIVLPGLAPGDPVVACLEDFSAHACVSVAFPEFGPVSGADIIVVGQWQSAAALMPDEWIIAAPSVSLGSVADETEKSSIFALAFDDLPRRARDAFTPRSFGPDLDRLLEIVGEWQNEPLSPFLSPFDNGASVIGARHLLPMATFVIDGQPNRSGTYDLALSGRARYLVRGGYRWLPRGIWRIEIVFAVDTDGAVNTLRIEWGDVNTFSQHAFTPSVAGRYSITIDHVLESASLTELRLVLGNSSLSGELVLEQLALERRG